MGINERGNTDSEVRNLTYSPSSRDNKIPSVNALYTPVMCTRDSSR